MVEADVRIIAATNKDLSKMVKKETFREDLFYRINVVRLNLPSLRERMEDIPLLIEHFITKMNRLRGKNITHIDDEALSAILSHPFPGNIRELENIIEYAFVLCAGKKIQLKHLPGNVASQVVIFKEHHTMDDEVKSAESRVIIAALKRNNYNRSATAHDLGMHKSTLFRKIERLGLSLPKTDGRSKQNTPK